jgi:drug/metabolite transporter (DMT)-like permease
MISLIFWILVYTFIMAVSQVLLKIGLTHFGTISVKSWQDIYPLVMVILHNYYLLGGTILMGSSFFLWLAMLSWFKLGVIFPLTALVYVFVALLTHFWLGEELYLINYFGILLIAAGIFFLLLKQG